MTKRVLVLGMNPFDSGKTVLSLKISKTLKELGASVEYFKPFSGSNYWYKYQHIQTCQSEGKLYSFDAHRARVVLDSTIPIEITNPIHTLFVPAILEKPDEIISHSLAMSGWDSILALRRFSSPEKMKIKTVTLVAKHLIDSGALMLTPEEVENLTRDSDIIPFESLEEVLLYTEQVLEGVLDASFDYIEQTADIVIIESFNNTAWPWEGLDRVDTVLAVGPGHIFVYDAERFRKATMLKKYNSQAIREVPFSRVAELIKPRERVLISAGEDIQQWQLEKMGIE